MDRVVEMSDLGCEWGIVGRWNVFIKLRACAAEEVEGEE